MFKYFENLIDPFPPAPPIQPPRGVYAFCRHYTRGIERYLLIMAALTAVLAVGEAMLYGILGQLVDWLASKDRAGFLDQEWPTLLAMSMFLLVFMPLLVVFNTLLVHQTLMGNFPMLVRWHTHRYLLGQSYGFFQNEFSGRVATKVMQTSLAVRESVMKVLDVMLFVSVYVITTLLLVAAADWRLCIPLLIWLLAYVVVLRFFVPRLQSVSMRQADARSLMTGRIVDSYTNILTIKLFSHSRRESDYVQHGMNEFLQTVHPQMRLVSQLNICVWILNMLLVFATGATGIFLWLHTAINPGAIAIAMSIAVRITGMSHWVMWEISNLFENIGVVQDGINTVSNEQSVSDDKQAQRLKVTAGEIDFRHISFDYGGQSAVFDGLDLRIKPGEKVGIVGRSGAGKSTLVNLLLRFYDLDRGQICIDGTDLRGVTQDSLRASIAMVTQDTSLLHRSVRENIVFGRPNATEEQMIEAAKRAHAHEFIMRLSDVKGRKGYDAHVGERGVSLSGGQRQRVAIARVVLKDAPILVLDEATSALDSEVEAGIQESLFSLMEGKTVMAIAHRLSTIAAMDRLIVMDEGRIVEEGSHSELLSNKALYAQLWAHQSGGFLGDE
ncbi:MAG: ATP-binding cassette subfamily B protein/ATP-binding cassette subfamily B multidrug efflux pump [Oceanicoccus sp.]|jgi:ATP-binding cassette subfamily B protein/ATP-binding cassette subfamily B multidrug efflux pump